MAAERLASQPRLSRIEEIELCGLVISPLAMDRAKRPCSSRAVPDVRPRHDVGSRYIRCERRYRHAANRCTTPRIMSSVPGERAALSAGRSARRAMTIRRWSCNSNVPWSASQVVAASTSRRYGSRPSPDANTAATGSLRSSGCWPTDAAARYGRFATIKSTGTGTGASRSPGRTKTRSSSRCRWTLIRASATARRSLSVAHTKAFAQRVAIAIAIAPEPVPTSAIRAARDPMRAQLAATSRSLAARGVITNPGAALRSSP